MSDTSTLAYWSDYFRWLPAMGIQDGRIVIAVEPGYLSLDDLEVVEAGSVLPDMNHPGTLGCIEHVLLPEKWPGCSIRTAREGANASISIMNKYGTTKFSIANLPVDEVFMLALIAPLD